MNRLILVVAIFVVICAGAVSAYAVPDFSGTWVLDLDKSDFGGKNPPDKTRMKKVVITITQTAAMLQIERTTGDIATYHLDGSESLNTLPGGGQSKTTMRWSGDTLVATTVTVAKGTEVKATDERSLRAAGKEMVLQLSIFMPSGERRQTLVYNKQ